MEMFLAMLIKPFLALGVLCIAFPIKRAVQRMPDCRLKRILLISWR
jgi:hypothetical protein